MSRITQMIRSGKGEWSSAALCRDSAVGVGGDFWYAPLMAAADRIDQLDAEIKFLKEMLITELDISYQALEIEIDKLIKSS
jgi:hypothetical protein